MSGKRAMIESAQRGIVLVDHARFYRVALHGLAPISDFDPVFVVPGVDESHLDELRERSIPFEVAPL